MRFSVRRLLLLVALLGTAFAAYRWLPNELSDAERIRIIQGMTKEEVIRLVGRADTELEFHKGRTYWSYGWGLGAYPIVFDSSGRVVEIGDEVFADF